MGAKKVGAQSKGEKDILNTEQERNTTEGMSILQCSMNQEVHSL
jgi:hypothetical protein